MKRFFKLSPLKLSMLVTLAVIVGYKYDYILRLPQQIEWRILDFRFRSRGIEADVAKQTPVTIVAIDEKTLSELGRWPFSRSYMGDLVRNLRKAGTSVIAFDIVFAEEDRNSELMKMRQLRDLTRNLGLDNMTLEKTGANYKQSLSAAKESQEQVATSVRKFSAAIKSVRARNRAAKLANTTRYLGQQIDNLQQSAKVIQKQDQALQKLNRFISDAERKANNDLYFANALSGSEDVVLGYFFQNRSSGFAHVSTEEVQEKLGMVEDSRVGAILDDRGEGQQIPRISYGTPYDIVVPNIPIISKAARWDGHFVQLPDGDGGIRWYPAVVQFGNSFYPSLGLMAAARYLDEDPLLHVNKMGLIDKITLGEHEIPLDARARALINYRGPGHTFETVSFVDVIRGKVDPALLKDRIALIGPTAMGIYDLRVTPFDSVMPGVEIHANAISNILNNDFLQKPIWMIVYDLMSLVAIGLLLGLFLAPLPSVFSGIIVTLITVGYLWLANYMMWEQRIWLTTIYQLANIVFGFIAIVVYKYVTEEKKRKEIKSAFQYYLNPEVVEEVTKDPDRLRLGGEKRELSILFSDIRSFTTISEKLDAQELSQLLNEYLTPMTNLVFDYKGTLDKYIGDALMAFFGAPLAYPDGGHAWRSCHVALDMMDELAILRQGWAEKGLPMMDIGIGINTGEVSVGNMGSAQRFDYTVLGDSVNLAARLEGINKVYGTHIVISEFTKKAAGGSLFTRELDAVRVKGKLKPVYIFELLGKDADPHLEAIMRLFESGLAEYREDRFEAAIKTFEEVIRRRGADPTSTMFIERCQQLVINPPPADWGGVFTLKTK